LKKYIIAIIFILLVAWAFSKFRNQPAGVPINGGLTSISPSDDLNTKMAKMAEQAVIDAWKYNREVLDYSEGSVEKAETILASRQKWCAEQKFTEKDIRAEALIMGAYIGEVIRKHHGGSWVEGDDAAGPASYPLTYGKSKSYPYNWCYKRLTDGSNDNVWHKYLYFVRNEVPAGVNTEITKKHLNERASKQYD
jgi:hypothetical protein